MASTDRCFDKYIPKDFDFIAIMAVGGPMMFAVWVLADRGHDVYRRS